jgi:hypothetical protein
VLDVTIEALLALLSLEQLIDADEVAVSLVLTIKACKLETVWTICCFKLGKTFLVSSSAACCTDVSIQDSIGISNNSKAVESHARGTYLLLKSILAVLVIATSFGFKLLHTFGLLLKLLMVGGLLLDQAEHGGGDNL